MIKLGLVSVTFSKLAIEEVVRIAVAAGIDGIEWSEKGEHAVSMENIDKIKALSEENGLEIFSFGSYCYMTEWEKCEKALEMAVRLGAPVIRVWAGWKKLSDWTEETYAELVENTRRMADKAAEYRITLAFEYHRKTLTETAESAVRLIKTVDRENVKLYWQNSAAFTYEENLQNLTAVTPYLAGVFHLGNGRGGQGPQLIEGIREEIEGFYQPFLKTDYKVMMEFVKGGLEESFYSDINVLRECFSLGEATN